MAAVDPLGYDELPYPCAPYPQTHPEHLATLACLLGLEYPDIENARILEIGCGDGANLIPLAYSLPGAELLGIDLSVRQVEAGQAIVVALGLKQVQLCVRDLRKLNEADGPFDYIIAHGVYSWTPPEVCDALLALFRRNLAPLGIGLISYNTLPGWSDRLTIRHWLREAFGTTRGGAQVAEARRLMRQLLEILQGDATPRGEVLRRELSKLMEWSDGYLRHDLLEDFNEPVCFRQFSAHLATHGLRFLAEADFPPMVGQGLPPQMAIGVQRLARGAIEREQLFDLLTNREFRQSLIIHSEREVARSIDPRVVERLYVGSPMKPDAPADSPARPRTFRASGGFAIEVSEPLVAACLTRLSEIWPAWMSFDELADHGRSATATRQGTSITDAEFSDLRGRLATLLLAGFAERAVEFHVAAAPFSVAVSGRPQASPLARWQAKSTALVTNLRHDLVQLSPAAHALLPFLDGDRDPSASPVSSADIGATLQHLARAALLIA